MTTATTEIKQRTGSPIIEAQKYVAPNRHQRVHTRRLSASHYLLFAALLLSLLAILFLTIASSIVITVVTPELEKPEEMVSLEAEIDFDSWLKLPIGNRVLVLPGSHQISIGAPGFVARKQQLKVNRDRYQTFELTMLRQPGVLNINLQPSVEAAVSINGEIIGSLPGAISNVPAGKHHLLIDAPLYRPIDIPVVVQGKGQVETVAVELTPAWAEYRISSSPDSAIVFIDEQEVGRTPLNIKLEEGNHSLRIERRKYKPIVQSLLVVAEQDRELKEFKLSPADATLQLESQPQGAAILVNRRYHGVSPVSLTVPAHEEQLIEIYKAGYKRQSHKINLEPEQRYPKLFSLCSDLVPVEFSLSPANASLIIDGVSHGRGSKTVNLSTLPHRVQVTHKGHVSYDREFVPTRRSAQLLSIKLLTTAQHYWSTIKSSYTTKAGQEMILIRAPGEVLMGSPRREVGRRANEVRYRATLNRHFYVSKHEITNKQFRLYAATHNSGNYKRKSLDSGKHPVVNVSWQKAALYGNWLSKKEGLKPFYKIDSGYVSGNNTNANGYRLLTEVEWTWLATARQKQNNNDLLVYPWGSSRNPPPSNRIGNFADQNAQGLVAFTLENYDDGYAASSPVGKYPVNDNGLYDMGGNVSEWVNDWYDANTDLATKKEVLVDYLGPDIGEFHVVRGGSWAKGHLPQLRLAYRDYGAKGKHDIGFRIARYVGEPE